MTLITMTTVTNQLFTSFSESVGFGAATGGFMVSVAMICDIAWNPLIGITCDKFGADKGVILWCVVTILSFVCLTVGASVPALAFIGAGLNDTMYACYGTGIAMLTAFLFGNKDYAKIYSLVPAIGYALGCMGVPILRASTNNRRLQLRMAVLRCMRCCYCYVRCACRPQFQEASATE